MRAYICDIAGGTATATIQITENQTLRSGVLTFVNAAAGKIELSRLANSQIGTAQPSADVLFRASAGAAGQTAVRFDLNEKVKAFQNLYVHCTGAGNLGTMVLS